MKKSSLERFLVAFSVVQFCLLGFPRNSMPGEGAAVPVHPLHRNTNVDSPESPKTASNTPPLIVFPYANTDSSAHALGYVVDTTTIVIEQQKGSEEKEDQIPRCSA